MKCQILFSGKNKKNINNLLSAELAQGVVKVNINLSYIVFFHKDSCHTDISRSYLLRLRIRQFITKTCLSKYIENFTSKN